MRCRALPLSARLPAIDPVQKIFEFKTDNGQKLRVSLALNVRSEQQYAHSLKNYVGYTTFDNPRLGDWVRFEHHSNRNSGGIPADRAISIVTGNILSD